MNGEVFEDAADLLEKEGWIQGMLQNKNGRCAVGALYAVVGQHNVDAKKAFEFLKASLLEKHGAAWWGLWEGYHVWNDAPDRTKQEVLDLLRFAAKRASE